MSHRANIRAQFKAALLGQTAAETRIFTSRSYPITPREMPALLVYTGSETRSKSGGDGQLILRDVDVVVEAVMAAGDDPQTLEDDIDAFTTAVEDLIISDSRLSQRMVDVSWVGTAIDFAVDGRVQFAAARVEFVASVFTNAADPLTEFGVPNDITVTPTEPPLVGDWIAGLPPQQIHPARFGTQRMTVDDPQHPTPPRDGFLHGAEVES